MTFARFDTTTISSGRRMLATPRRYPCPASATSAAGSPTAAILKYVKAYSPDLPFAPSPRRSGSATASPRTSSVKPIPSETQSAWAASRAARSDCPAPDARATTAVVP